MSDDDRGELLRTQAVHAILGALGGAQVMVHGNDSFTGVSGVFLDNESEVTSRTYWRVGDEKFEYAVQVSVNVHRRKVR